MTAYGDELGKFLFIDAMVSWIREDHPDVWGTSMVDPWCDQYRLDCHGDMRYSAQTAEALMMLREEYLAKRDA